MSEITRAAQRAHHSDALEVAIRVGLVAYGVVHVLIGWLALQVAFGEKSTQASSTGAMHALASQPLGAALVWVVAIGLLALVVWRALEAWRAWRTEDGTDRLKSVAGQGLKAVIYAVLAVTALKTALGDSAGGRGAGGGGGGGGGGGKGGGGSTDTLTAQLLAMPGGTILVAVVGLAVVGYAGYYVWQGWTDKFLEKLDGAPKRREVSKAYRMLGKVGFVAKGVAIGVIGALFVYAALTHDPQKSAGLDQALQEIAQQPFGQALLVAVAFGIACYGVFCFARARHHST
jgi:hypothetical protein